MADYANRDVISPNVPGIDPAFLPSSGAPVVYNPKGLRRWRTALNAAQFAPARINIEADSRGAGVGVENVNAIINNAVSDQLSFAGVLRTRFARAFGVAEAGFIYPRVEGTDPRVVNVGGTPDSSTDPFQLAYRLQTGNSSTTTLPTCTNIDVLAYNDANITGGFSYAVDGGAATTVTATSPDANGVTSGAKRFAISGLAQGTHSLVLTGTSGSNSVIFGADYHSGAGVLVRRRARAGYTVLDMFGLGAAFPGNNAAVGNAPAGPRMLATAGLGNADLTIIHFDYNDWQAQISAAFTSGLRPTPDIFQRFLQQRVNACIAAGGCVLLLGGAYSPFVTTPPGGQPLEQYWAALKAIAASTDHCAALILGEYWKSAADGVALGLNASSTSIHPSKKGYGGIADLLYDVLTQPIFGA